MSSRPLKYLKGRHIAAHEQGRVLAEVLLRARTAYESGACVFDLDSTLLDNRERQAHILREFGLAHGMAPLTAARAEHFISWSLVEAMRATGLSDPEARRIEPEVRSFWRSRFFTSDYCTHDAPLPGAAHFLQTLAQLGCQIIYCTGRHHEMRQGTLNSFSQAGFPLPDGKRTHLLLKPRFEHHDDAWKRDAVALIRALGEVIAAFDNEPAHVNIYAAAFPEARVVHLATDDSGRNIPVTPGVPSIADFTFGATAQPPIPERSP